MLHRQLINQKVYINNKKDEINNNSSFLLEYKLNNQSFDPSPNSPPNEFLIKLQQRIEKLSNISYFVSKK